MSNQFPLLTQQKGLLFHQEFGDLKSAYINHVVVVFNEVVSVEALKKASESLVCDFSILRAHIEPSNNFWVVNDDITADFEYRSLSYSPDSIDVLLATEMADTQFHISRPPLMRFRLFQVTESSSYFVISYHHILLAGRCALEMLERLLMNYDRSLSGNPLLEAPKENNAVLIQRIQTIDVSTTHDRLRHYFHKMTEPTQLPNQTTSSFVNSPLSTLSFINDIKECETIREYCRTVQISPNLFFHLAWSLTLSWYVPQETFCFGTTREFPRQLTKNHAGFFMSIMPLVVTLTQKTNIHSVISALKEQHLLFPESVFVPYNTIRSYTHVPNDMPLFDSVIDFKPYSPEAFLHHRHPNWRQRHVHLRFTTHYPCFIEVYQDESGALCHRFRYHSKCFSTEWMQQSVQHYKQIIKQLIKNHNLTLPARELNPYTQTEREVMLDKLQGPVQSLDSDQSLWSRIKIQSQQHPQNIALICEENQITYAEMIASVERIACYLQKALSLQMGDIVFVDLERTIQLPIVLLALHRLNICFIPFNAVIMSQHLSEYIRLTGAKVFITDRSLNAIDTGCSIKKLNLPSNGWKNVATDKNELLLSTHKSSLTELFYILFTSGTTGKPKGVRVSQKNVLNILSSLQVQLSFKSEDCFFALSDYTFDIAYLELLLPLLSGGRCVIGTVCEKQDHALFLKRITQHRVTMIQATPTYWRYLLSLKTLTPPAHPITLITGGEILDLACAKRLLEFGTTVWNAYGPTETTIWSSLHRVTQDDIQNGQIPIGHPIANTCFHILNPYQQPTPQGVPGELYISGLGVADGYVTSSKQQTNSFVRLKLPSGELCIAYRTGDKVCLNHAEQLFFYCRYDEQIKLQGHRIEIPYIERTLMEHPSISAGALKMWGTLPRNYLVAYLVSQDLITEKDIRTFLQKKLPEYMIPSRFVFLEDLPRTVQGKVDKARLVLPPTDSENNFLSPNETVIRKIWSQTLELPLNEINADSHFFQLGGHSLTAALVVQEVNKLFDVALSIKTLFQAPTIRAFTTCLEKAEKANQSEPAIPRTLLKHIPLSDQQARLWTYERLQPGTSIYNMFVAFELAGPLNVKALSHAFHFIVQKHTILRTTIHEKEGKPIQIVHNEGQQSFAFLNWRDEKEDLPTIKKRVKQHAYALAQRHFQLDKEPPLIVQLIQCSEHYFVLLINVHHIACDGWSLRLLLSDLNHLYNQQLPQPIPTDLPAAYPDFAAWQQNQRTEAYLQEAKKYWVEYLRNADLAILPYDKKTEKDSQFSTSGKRVRFSLGHTLSQKIREFSQQNQCTPFASMITIFAALLHRYILLDRLILYTVSDGRLSPATHSIVGFFSNLLPIVFDFSTQIHLVAAMTQFTQEFSKAITYQSVPWDILQSALPVTSTQDSVGANKILFVQQDTLENPIQWDGIEAKRLFSDNKTLLLSDYDSSKFDLCVYVQWHKNECIGLIEYNTQKFYAKTIDDLIKNYQNLLDSLIALPTQSLSTASFSSNPAESAVPVEIMSEHFKHYPNVIESLATRCKEQPTDDAIVYNDEAITYERLWERTEALARTLLTQLTSQRSIAVCMPTTLDTLLIFIAIVRAGCPYLPIDPEQPISRIEAILNDANPQALIVDANFSSSNLSCRRINNDDLFRSAATQNSAIELPPVTAHHSLAYLLYTSGSTGKPKGVQVSHVNLSHLLGAGEELFRFSATRTRWSLIHSLGFDFSVWEMWGALLSGGTLVIMSRDECYHPERFLQTLAKHCVSVLNITPSLFSLCLATLSTKPALLAQLRNSLKTIIFGGESITHCSLRSWFQSPLSKNVSLINMYGITEGTVHATYYSVTDNTPLHRSIIGRAIPGMSTHVLDDHKRPVPAGIIGELHLEGHGVTVGYLNPSSNDQHRFWELIESDGSSRRFFQTGDLVRTLSSGDLEYIGRKDDQLCLRGYRIELAELRHALCDFPAVDATYLDVLERDGQTIVDAYVTLREDKNKLSCTQLQSHHISSWQQLYNQIYNIPQCDKLTFNTVGWRDSATGNPIPDIEMHEWRDLTLEKIRPLYNTSSHVAELGCGTGLLLFPIAPDVATYTGIDISEIAITNLQKNVTSLSWSNKVDLSVQEAYSFLSKTSQHYDLIILNSVIQYFPHAHYLWEVINRAIEAIASGGSIFIGDVRNFCRQSLYQRYAQRGKSENEQNFSDEELLVDPLWFHHFCLQHPRVNYIKIDYKAGKYPNEMNYFRYDVVIGIERKRVSALPDTIRTLPWENLNLTDLSKQLHESPVATRITDIFYRNLCELECTNLENSGKKIALPVSAITPYDLVTLAKKMDWQLLLPWSASNGMTQFDAILYPRNQANQIDALFYQFNATSITSSASDLAHYCNDPLSQMNMYHLQTALGEHLKKRLPHYMQPNQVSIVSHLPLTLNGKIDRHALRAMKTHHISSLQLPLTALESEVGKIWNILLKQSHIDGDSDFFALGGHSLLAIQLLSEIEKQYDVILPIQDFYTASTLSAFCRRLSDCLLQKVLPKVPKETHSLKNASIITFQEEGQEPPLFLIHPLGGTVFVYLDLLRYLEVNRPIYAIQDPGITQPKKHYASLEALAKEYRTWIQSIQPKGPYYLAGSSLGGTLAYEIAYQLEQEGQTNKSIIMFDSWALYTEDFHDQERLKKGLMRQYHFIKEKLGGVNLPQAAELITLNYERLKLVLRYRPPVLHNTVWLYKSMTLRTEFIPIDEPTNHWKHYCRGIIHTVLSPGDHETMLVGKNAKQLAAHLQEVLQGSAPSIKLTPDYTVNISDYNPLAGKVISE